MSNESLFLSLGVAGEMMQSNPRLAEDLKKMRLSPADLSDYLISKVDTNEHLAKTLKDLGFNLGADGKKLLMKAAKGVQYSPDTKVVTLSIEGKQISISLRTLLEAKIDMNMASSMKEELRHGI